MVNVPTVNGMIFPVHSRFPHALYASPQKRRSTPDKFLVPSKLETINRLSGSIPEQCDVFVVNIIMITKFVSRPARHIILGLVFFLASFNETTKRLPVVRPPLGILNPNLLLVFISPSIP